MQNSYTLESVTYRDSNSNALTNSSTFNLLLAEFAATSIKLKTASENMERSLLDYFIRGNSNGNDYFHAPINIFDLSGAIKALTATYWQKAMEVTQVRPLMPEARRNEWDKSIREMNCPEFTPENLESTIISLLNSREMFLAEKVDGIFRGLSDKHVTNSPAGFSKRMIIENVIYNEYQTNYRKEGLLDDLRSIIATFQGQDPHDFLQTSAVINTLKKRYGEWFELDGNALRIKLYKKGTVHLEVHPDMAYRLNATIAALHPFAIPEEFRRKPAEGRGEGGEIHARIEKPLCHHIRSKLRELRNHYILNSNGKQEPVVNTIGLDKYAVTEVVDILRSIGGVEDESNKYNDKRFMTFDFDPIPVIQNIVISALIPDDKSYQFYATPENIAELVMSYADIEAGMTVLEPSAGLGGLADYIPKDALITCVEQSRLRADVLKAKGYNVTCQDFMTYSSSDNHTANERFDRIVMNPPFTKNQWKDHLNKALQLLKKDGILVAVLPGSVSELKGGRLIERFSNQFENTKVNVGVWVFRV